MASIGPLGRRRVGTRLTRSSYASNSPSPTPTTPSESDSSLADIENEKKSVGLESKGITLTPASSSELGQLDKATAFILSELPSDDHVHSHLPHLSASVPASVYSSSSKSSTLSSNLASSISRKSKRKASDESESLARSTRRRSNSAVTTQSQKIHCETYSASSPTQQESLFASMPTSSSHDPWSAFHSSRDNKNPFISERDLPISAPADLCWPEGWASTPFGASFANPPKQAVPILPDFMTSILESPPHRHKAQQSKTSSVHHADDNDDDERFALFASQVRKQTEGLSISEAGECSSPIRQPLVSFTFYFPGSISKRFMFFDSLIDTTDIIPTSIAYSSPCSHFSRFASYACIDSGHGKEAEGASKSSTTAATAYSEYRVF